MDKLTTSFVYSIGGGRHARRSEAIRGAVRIAMSAVNESWWSPRCCEPGFATAVLLAASRERDHQRTRAFREVTPQHFSKAGRETDLPPLHRRCAQSVLAGRASLSDLTRRHMEVRSMHVCMDIGAGVVTRA